MLVCRREKSCWYVQHSKLWLMASAALGLPQSIKGRASNWRCDHGSVVDTAAVSSSVLMFETPKVFMCN